MQLYHTMFFIVAQLQLPQAGPAGGGVADPMGTLTRINTILGQLRNSAATIGITLAGLMVGIYAMGIMLSHDTSAMANRNRWENLQKVLICAGIIGGIGVIIQFAQGLGNML